MTNSILSRALLQLTSLVKHADGIFTNLSDECRKVYDRTNQINERILTLTKCVENLNPKKELIRKWNFHIQPHQSLLQHTLFYFNYHFYLFE